VNPLVAVFLGWAIAGEAVTSRTLVAAAIILVGVAMISPRRVTMMGGGELRILNAERTKPHREKHRGLRTFLPTRIAALNHKC